MKKKKIQLIVGKKRFDIEARVIPAESFGLMFKSKKRAKPLLFNFERDIKLSFSSLFVFFPFVIIWLDSDNHIVDKKLIKPFKFHIPSREKYRRVLEIPCNSKYSEICKALVEDKKFKY